MASLEEFPEVDKVFFRSVTPAGIEVAYSPAPRRYYAVRKVTGRDVKYGPIRTEWTEVPSVTSVLGCLEKPLGWWGMTVGVEGVFELFERDVLSVKWPDQEYLTDKVGGRVTPADVVRFLTQEKLTVNHTLSKAGDRGTSVHDAFEDWAVNGTIPHPEIYPETERPYVEGLVKFLHDFDNHKSDDLPVEVWRIKSEVMVGSLEHQYAGRYDLRCSWSGGPMVTKVYPKRANKVEELPGGRYLLDLKTSSGVYQSHALQLAAYEGASVECGYEPTDYRAVIHVTKTGEYELVVTSATLEDFLAVRKTYEVLQRKMLG